MTPLLVFQLRRVGRNRQFLIFTVLLPALFTVFFTKIFGGQAPDAARYQDFAGDYMVSMMAYGGLGAALGATIRISFDRASGWLRQLRITPVDQTQIFAVDVAVGALLTLPSLVVVALVGRFVNDVQLGLGTWVALVGVLWAGSIAFVAFGLLIGLSLDEKAAGGAIGFVGVVLAALGGLWVPVRGLPRDDADDRPRHAVLLVRGDGPGRRRRRGAVRAGGPRARRVHRGLRRPRGARGAAAAAVRRGGVRRCPAWTHGIAGGRRAGPCPGCCSSSSRSSTWSSPRGPPPCASWPGCCSSCSPSPTSTSSAACSRGAATPPGGRC